MDDAQKNSKILLVEDNHINQVVALQILKKRGYAADTASNGKEALDALGRKDYELVLMDVQMPEMDGLETTRRIRSPESAVLNHEVPIIAMTAYSSRDDHNRCLGAGMNDYLAKPLDMEHFLSLVKKYLEPGSPSAPGTPSPPPPITSGGQAEGTELPVVDRDELLSRLGGDKELAKKIFARFIQKMDRLIAELKNTLSQGDAEEIRKAAHSLNGASGNVSLSAFHRIVVEIEEAAKAGDTAAARGGAEKLDYEAQRIRNLADKLFEDL